MTFFFFFWWTYPLRQILKEKWLRGQEKWTARFKATSCVCRNISALCRRGAGEYFMSCQPSLPHRTYTYTHTDTQQLQAHVEQNRHIKWINTGKHTVSDLEKVRFPPFFFSCCENYTSVSRLQEVTQCINLCVCVCVLATRAVHSST